LGAYSYLLYFVLLAKRRHPSCKLGADSYLIYCFPAQAVESAGITVFPL